MRILYCIPHLYNSGGMERVLTQKINWLATHTMHELTIITTELTPKGLNECYFPLNKRVKVVALDIDFNADYKKTLCSKWMGHMRRLRAYEKALRKYVNENHIDLCISLCGKEVAFLRKLPCRTMVEMHFAKDQRQQLLMATHQGWFWSLLGCIRTRQLLHAVRPLESVVVLTRADQAEWKNEGCRNVVVIPNPCAFDGQKIPVKPRKKTLLAVGRLHEQKGFDLLLQSWQTLEKKYPEWTLRIVGEGPMRAELETQIQAMGLQRVYLAGKVDNMAEEYAEASLFVLSSRYEGLPLALIEAMWCGTPCVSFDCPHGPAELLADERGWLVPEGDIAALTRQLEYLLSHPEEAAEHAQKAQTFAHTMYSEKNIMPLWQKLIEQ